MAFAGLWTRPLAAKEKGAQSFRVLSYNVWGLPHITPARRARLDAIGAAIVKLSPDVVMLQEVWLPEDGKAMAKALSAAGLSHHYAQEGSNSDSGSGLWFASRHPILDVQFHPFTMGRPILIPWHLDWMASKGVCMATIDTPFGALIVANTHLQAQYFVRNYKEVILSQAYEVARFVADQSHKTRRPVILAGDFNVEPDQLPFQLMAQRAKLSVAGRGFEIDAQLFRSAGDLTIEARDVRQLWKDAVRLRTGETVALSDHPAILVDYAMSRRSVPARKSTWRPLGQQAEVVFRRSYRRTLAWLDVCRAFGAVLPILLLMGALQARRRRTFGLRVLRFLATVSVLALCGWLLHIGWVWGPQTAPQLERQRLEIATDRQSAPR